MKKINIFIAAIFAIFSFTSACTNDGVTEPKDSSEITNSQIFWTDKDSKKIQRANLDGSDIVDILTSADGLINPRGIVIDTSKRNIIWADATIGSIFRSDFSGNNVETLLSDLGSPTDIVIDKNSEFIYWTEQSSGLIRRCPLDMSTTPENVVSNLTEPYYLAVDFAEQKIYWSDFDNSIIHCSNLDGTNIDTLITGLARVRDIVTSPVNDKIFWCDRNSHKIQCANYETLNNIEDVFTSADGLDRPHGMVMDQSSELLYWTDTRTSSIHRGKVDGTGEVDGIVTGLKGPWGITIYDPSK